MNIENKLISIIVPIYNTCNYLHQCVDSILSQTYLNLEIILVDDGSTDGSEELCDKYEELDSRVHVIHKSNGGSSSARKAGIDAMHGQYGMLIYSDDWLDLNAIEKCVEIIYKEKADCVLFSYYREYENSYLSNLYTDIQVII